MSTSVSVEYVLTPEDDAAFFVQPFEEELAQRISLSGKTG